MSDAVITSVDESIDEKKSKELAMLNRALDLARKSGGAGRRNADRLRGEIEHRERPDFVILAPDGRAIGIEHFRADKLIERKRRSAAVKYAKQLERFRVENKDAVDEKGVTQEIADQFGAHVATGFDLYAKASMMDLHRSLDSCLNGENGHNKKLQAYKRNIECWHPEKKVEIGYLIELHADFTDLIMNDGMNARRIPSGATPMFEEIYELLKATSELVDWMIIAYCSSIADKPSGALIADCRNGMFAQSLRRKKMFPVKYLGGGHSSPRARINKEGNVRSEIKGETIVYDFEKAVKLNGRDDALARALEDAASALMLSRSGGSFTTTCPIQFFYEMTRGIIPKERELVTGRDIYNAINSIPATKKEELRIEFEKRWGIEPGNARVELSPTDMC